MSNPERDAHPGRFAEKALPRMGIRTDAGGQITSEAGHMVANAAAPPLASTNGTPAPAGPKPWYRMRILEPGFAVGGRDFVDGPF
jgi:hypothetical protein